MDSIKSKIKNLTLESEFWCNRYLKFIEKFTEQTYIKGKTHNHHILPNSIFPEYTCFKLNPWNKSILSHRSHYIAHYMLAKIFGDKMWFAFNNMNSSLWGKKKRINSILYSNAIKNLSNIQSNRQNGKVVCKNLEGQTFLVSSEEFYSNNLLIGIMGGRNMGDSNGSKQIEARRKISEKRKNTLYVLNIKTKIKSTIKKEEYNENIHIKISPLKGKKTVVVRDSNNLNKKMFSVGIDDSKFLSGEYIGHRVKLLTLILVSPDGKQFKFNNSKHFDMFCDNRNISSRRLYNHSNKVYNTMRGKLSKNIKVSNTVGWMLIIDN